MVLAAAAAWGYAGVALGATLLSLCVVSGVVAVATSFGELPAQQRELFRWIALSVGLASVAEISSTLHARSAGARPPFPALADYLLLLAELALVAGFFRLLRSSHERLRFEALADLLLVSVAAAVVILPLGTVQLGVAFGTIGVDGKLVAGVSLLSAAGSLVLLALIIAWRGEDLSRRALLGLSVGAVAMAVFTAWTAQVAVSGAQTPQVPMDMLAAAAVLGFVSALDVRRTVPTLELKVAERTAALTGAVEELKGVITEERAMRSQIIERERLASIGSIVGGVAHEINNPLSSISAFAQLLLNEKDLNASQRESIEAIYAEAMRAANVIRDLRAFARRSASENRAVDLNEIVARTVRLRSYQMDTANVRVTTALDVNLPMVFGDPQQLQQVVVNLMSNAISSMPDGGDLRITTRAEEASVVLEFVDSGFGVADDLQEHIFDPFFGAKGRGDGSGMGLSVSYGIVAAHGGSLRLADGSPGRTTFVVELPASRWRAEGGDVVPSAAAAGTELPASAPPSSAA